MIQVSNLVKKYGVHTAVDDLSFTVEKGQIYGFLGPNGAGKSTTMNIMTGYIAANSGTVTINGYDILKEPEKAKRCIGYLPEVPPLYTDMTVWEYLMFAAELKKVERRERAAHVEEIIDQLQLKEVQERLIRNLSKGYKQRVGLAQALTGDPEVLILDEPMVGLDPKQIIEMRDLIRGLAQEHTVILSSHILSEVSAVCDHIMIISAGKLMADGSPEELQQMMHGRAVLAVTAFGTKEQAEEILSGMEQIASYSVETGQETDTVSLHVEALDNADIRKDLSTALAGAGMAILSMSRVEKSLEDIFLQLTGNSNETPAAEDGAGEDNSEQNQEQERCAEDSVEKAEKEETDDDSDL